jgi:hypothetical protein
MNEFYLFHGTSSKNARLICEHGFDERVADLNDLYGAGTYFAINSCKSHQYSLNQKDSSNFVVLVCRVVLGSPYCTCCHEFVMSGDDANAEQRNLNLCGSPRSSTARAPRGGVTRQGVVLIDLQSLCDCQ